MKFFLRRTLVLIVHYSTVQRPAVEPSLREGTTKQSARGNSSALYVKQQIASCLAMTRRLTINECYNMIQNR
jgi:hypothetical protein